MLAGEQSLPAALPYTESTGAHRRETLNEGNQITATWCHGRSAAAAYCRSVLPGVRPCPRFAVQVVRPAGAAREPAGRAASLCVPGDRR